MLGRKSFKLDPVWVPLDRALAAMLSDPFVSGIVGEGFSSAYCRYPSILQDELGLSRLREKHKNMILADQKIVKMTAAAKATFLRLDKEFRKTVTGPLKDAMINGKDINYEALEGKARSIHTQATECCHVLRSKFINRQQNIVHMALKEELGEGTGPQPLASSDT
ncbi:hypothetical protein CBS147343_10572 [Aspergillus niger]|nr:hypothetical protein CBS11350_5721 [Aspergillus niger]KAI2910206.1 hypothetical protein CBS147371_9110 [Aspergillus niger]KAI2941467.1 hypothetical protein CBS147321_5906 [Aspergillus niger]KAI3056236.1 hypothetical protein CBS147343_10572 [Aspergillus niger]